MRKHLLDGAGESEALNEELKDWYFAAEKMVGDSCDYEGMIKPRLPPMPSGRCAARSESPRKAGSHKPSNVRSGNTGAPRSNSRPRQPERTKGEAVSRPSSDSRPPLIGQRVSGQDAEQKSVPPSPSKETSASVQETPPECKRLQQADLASEHKVVEPAPVSGLCNANAINDWLAEANKRMNEVFEGTPAALAKKEEVPPSIAEKLSSAEGEDLHESNPNAQGQLAAQAGDPDLQATIRSECRSRSASPLDEHAAYDADELLPELSVSGSCLDRVAGQPRAGIVGQSPVEDTSALGLSISREMALTSQVSMGVGTHDALSTGHAPTAAELSADDAGDAEPTKSPLGAQRGATLGSSMRSSRKGLGGTGLSYGDDFEEYEDEEFEEASADDDEE